MGTSPKRTLAALAIFLALTLGTATAVSYQDTSHAPAGPLPAIFHLADARVGDKANYTWDHVRVADDGNVTILAEHDMIGMEWLPPQPMRDGQGQLHDTNTLHQWGWQTKGGSGGRTQRDDGEWERYAEPVYAIDRATDAIVAYSYVSETASDPNQRYGGAHVLQAQLLETEAHFMPQCGAYSAYQGMDVPLDESIDLFKACQGFSNHFQSNPHAVVQAVGTQQIGDQTTVLFASEDNVLMVWLDESIPFPVRIAALADDGTYNVLRMERFQRGTQSLTWTGTEAGQPATTWDMKPSVGKLPDESGIQHPFAASTALAAARSNATAATFIDVLDHGYLTFLDYHEDSQGDASRSNLHRTWDFSAYDGTRNASIQVAQHTQTTQSPPQGPLPPLPTPPVPLPTPPLPTPPSPVPSPTPAPSQAKTVVEVRATSDRGGGPWPSPNDAPSDMPTVASMWMRWHDFASTEYKSASANDWGLRIGCLGTDCDADHIYVERWAGIQQSQSWTNGTGTESTFDSRSVSSVLSESNNPRRGHEATLTEQSYTWSNSAPAPKHSQAVPATGQLTLIRSTAWIAPPPGVMAGGAVAAALASLLYLFWPILKGGGLTLFSRHASSQVLEHPERARMLQAIEARPGIHVRELARTLERARSPTEHHLAKMEQAGIVRVVTSGGYRCVFPRYTDARILATAGVTKADAAQRILHALAARPGIGARELARTLGLSPGTVAHHLRRLRQAGLVMDGPLGLATAPQPAAA